MNKIEDKEQSKLAWSEWYIDFMYRVYFKYSIDDNRDEIKKILVNQMTCVPSHQKSINYRIFKDEKQVVEFFKFKYNKIMRKSLYSNYNVIDDYLDMSNGFEFLPSYNILINFIESELEKSIHPILH